VDAIRPAINIWNKITNAFEKFHRPGEANAGGKLHLSSLVRRLISAREDAAKSVVHWHLLQHTDERLKESLGFTDDDIRALRGGELRRPWLQSSGDEPR
jgi:hypothetical protein